MLIFKMKNRKIPSLPNSFVNKNVLFLTNGASTLPMTAEAL
jgi:hypothetical protein